MTLYHLHSVLVGREIIEARVLKEEFFTSKNVEIRREVVRKFGVEAIFKKFGGKVLDEETITIDGQTLDYSLWLINLNGTTGKVPVLKMLNPSIGVWHMEFVEKNCKTVQQAIKFRNKSDLKPSKLT